MPDRPRFTRAEGVLISGAAAIVFTRVFAFSLVLQGFREFAGKLPGSTDLLVGTALGAYGLTMALAQLGMGVLSDRLGRKPVLILGSLLFVAGSAWAALAHSIWALLAARLVQGLGGVSSAAMAAVGETVPEERRTTAMALIGIPAGLGFFLGFIAGPFAQEVVGFRGLFWTTCVLGVVAVLPILLRPLPSPRGNLGTPGDRRSLGLPVLGLALGGFTINFAMNEVAFFLSGVPIGHTALALVLVGAFVVMAIASRAVDKSRATWQPIVACLGLLAVGAPLFVLSTTTTLLVAGGLLFFACHAVLSAILPSQVSRIAGRSGGRGHGIQLVVAYLGSAAGGVAAGAFATTPADAFAVLAAVAVVATAVVVAGLRRLAPAPMVA